MYLFYTRPKQQKLHKDNIVQYRYYVDIDVSSYVQQVLLVSYAMTS
jgi:hypothetical protein